MASPTHSTLEQNFLLRLISGALQILATETTAHLTEHSCQSERRRDINPTALSFPFRLGPSLRLSLLLSLESRRRGAADRRRKGETDYEVGRGGEERREKKERWWETEPACGRQQVPSAMPTSWALATICWSPPRRSYSQRLLPCVVLPPPDLPRAVFASLLCFLPRRSYSQRFLPFFVPPPHTHTSLCLSLFFFSSPREQRDHASGKNRTEKWLLANSGLRKRL